MAGVIKYNDILEIIVKQNKEIERLRNENRYLVSENDDLSEENAKVAELISDLQNQLNRANNDIEVLLKENKELKDNNDIQFRNLHRNGL